MALKQAILATGINDCAGDTSTPMTYRIKTNTTTLLDADIGVSATSLGPAGNGKPTRCILVAADYGVRIDMWSNALLNYVTGVQWGEDFRFKWVEDAVAWDWCKVYTLNYQEGCILDYNLVCVVLPHFKAGMLDDFKQYYPEVEKYYYMAEAKKVEEKKPLKMWGRDLMGLGKPWTLFLSSTEGGGTGTQDHLAKHKEDYGTYTGRMIQFPNPDIAFLKHDEEAGQAQFNAIYDGFKQVFAEL